jgi:hypothetical protein
MNSERFMEWVERKLVPTFEQKHPPEHKMVMVADMANLSKNKMIDLMIKHECDKIELPLTGDRRMKVVKKEGLEGEFLGNGFLAGFDAEQFSKRALKKIVRPVPSSQ